MQYKEAVKHLYSLEKYGWRFGLERIREALKKLGNPQLGLRYIHVAGTNGKGSVVAMLSSILREAGYTVGAFTSPHLMDLRERVTYQGQWIPKRVFARLAEKVKETRTKLTFFEFITAVAFLYFQEKDPDYVLLEAGLGGRLDATNVIRSEIAVITTVDKDHTAILGKTTEKITREKAGIIKKGCTVVTGTAGLSLEVMRDIAHSKDCKVVTIEPVNSPACLEADFQKFNAGIAKEVARQLNIPAKHIRAGLKKARWPGRLEYHGNILLDCAHNLSGIKALTNYVEELNYQRLIVVFGCLKDKDYRKMYHSLPENDIMIVTKPKNSRAIDPAKFPGRPKVIRNIKQALKYARSVATKKDLILVCGSIYLVGEVRKILNKSNQKPC